MFCCPDGSSGRSKGHINYGIRRKTEFLKRIGAQDVINYKTHPQWEDEVLKLTDNRGVDLVVEIAGAESIEQSIKASRFGGTIAMVGFMTPSKRTNLILPIIFGAKHRKSPNDPSKFTRTDLSSPWACCFERANEPAAG